jgi:dipeptidyl aminopeptidase/acylaminoacyl peptidase
MRFVFLRDGALWSGATDGTTGVVRLTPPSVTVAQHWIVRPPLAGRNAGDLLAYIDLQKGYVHTVRSDGQSDTVIQQPLFKPGVQLASLWDTDLGNTLLNSLAWSSDGSLLAFVADPTGSSQPGLYLASLPAGQVSSVPLPSPGTVSHAVWSPDGLRIAFELAHAGDVSILDYNTQNHGILTIAASSHSPGNASDTVLALDWSPSTQVPEITWSTGLTTPGHTHTVWSRRVGVSTTAEARLLASGDYVQAVYSRTGQNGTGSWLLITGTVGGAGSLAQLDLNAHSVLLASNRSIAFADWSPDGTKIAYLEATTQQAGVLHSVSAQTGLDENMASHVLIDPTPVWSADSLHLAYSTASGVFVADTHTAQSTPLPTLHVPASALVWSSSDPQQLIVSASNDQPGIYLLNEQSHSIQRLDTHSMRGPLLWTQIP